MKRHVLETAPILRLNLMYGTIQVSANGNDIQLRGLKCEISLRTVKDLVVKT